MSSILFSILFTTFLALLLSTTANAQSAEDPAEPTDVIDRFIEALGGEMSLISLETLSQKATYEGWINVTAQFHFKNGKRRCLTANQSMTLFDGEKWASSPNNSFSNDSPFELPTDALRLKQQVSEFIMVPKAEYATGEYADCVCLRIKSKDSDEAIDRYFDPESGLLKCVERGTIDEGEFSMAIRFFEYEFHEVEGVLFLKTERRTINDATLLDVEYSDLQVNQPVDDELFNLESDDD